MSEKRKQTWTSPLEAKLSAAEASNKRAKGAINSIVKEYVCPIALELPVDPVTAEDGRVYNRSDIQQHIDQSKRKKDDGSEEFEYRGLKSPMTKEPMGPNLLPAIQVRNSIRALIDSGAIEGDEGNIDQWKEVDQLRTDAEGGDPEAMEMMGNVYRDGTDGLIKDEIQAYKWTSKAAALDFAPAIGSKGACLLHGIGTKRNRVEGGTLLGIAAARGSAESQFCLGVNYYNGRHGYPKNCGMAKYWLQKAVAQEGEHALHENHSNTAKKLLRFIKEEEEGGNC